jgi:hypothetical protein
MENFPFVISHFSFVIALHEFKFETATERPSLSYLSPQPLPAC